MALDELKKRKIDALSIDQLEEQNAGRYAVYQGEALEYLRGRLSKLTRKTQDANIAKTHELAEEANSIAASSKRIAFAALVIAILSAIATIASVALQWPKS